MGELGFVGLGTMGGPMATHLVDAGHDLTVYDIDEDAVNRLVDRGAERTDGLDDVAARSDVVFLSLPRPEHVEAVVSGTEGLAAGIDEGDVIVDLSTSTPRTTEQIAADLAAAGVHVLGAPVSGGRAGAVDGTVSVMVGGDPEVLEACRPYIEAFSGEILHVGDEPGHGHAIKLLQNYLNFTAMVATSEATVLGEKAGLEMQTMLDVFNASSARSVATEVKFPEHVLPRTFDRGFTMALTEKDIRLFAQFGEEYDAPLMLGSTVRILISYARVHLGGDADQTRLYKYFADVIN